MSGRDAEKSPEGGPDMNPEIWSLEGGVKRCPEWSSEVGSERSPEGGPEGNPKRGPKEVQKGGPDGKVHLLL